MPRKARSATLKPDTPPTLPRRVRGGPFPEPTTPYVIEPPRPSWEYLTSRSDDGRMWAPPFAALGAEGWELVAVYRTGDTLYAPAYYAVFKRETK